MSGLDQQSFVTSEDELTSPQSPHPTESVPEEEISIWVDEKEGEHTKRNTIDKAFNTLSSGRISPLKCTLNTEWDDISTTQQKYYLRKAKEMFAATLAVISPGQEEQLWEVLRGDSLNEREDNIGPRLKHFVKSDVIDALIKAHEESQTWQTKRQILSIFANDFSRSELREMIPGLSKWQIDQARLHATTSGKGQPILEKQVFRVRIDNVKIDHFLDFISRPELLQDVAFGTKTLKLDSGDRIIIPAVVRTLIPTRIIEQYISYCNQQQFQPAGERSLYRILEVCSASMQKSLQGLDNITAEGTEAIDNLIKLSQTLEENGDDESWGKKIDKDVKAGKRYLKTDFKLHVGRIENCGDHCSTHSLSDPNIQEYHSKCTHKHDLQCERCEALEKVLDDVNSKIQSIESIDEELRSRLKFDFNQFQAAIQAWKAHLLRTVVQEEAKHEAMQKLDQQTCLIIVDWAMKFLPVKYRENMCEFFGKRGRSWHVSSVITKNEDKYDVECFVHIFNSCAQDSYAVASIFEHLFATIKSEYPLLSKAYIRSDNAGCYHNGPLLRFLAEIGTRTGLTPIRYDFSDPQAGKDICDRKIAPMKAHIRRYVNEKNDVVTAEDMKKAIESHGGLKGCRVAVVEMDSTKELNQANKIPGISLLYNFQFEDKGIRTWKAYKIGKGKLYELTSFQEQPKINDLKVISTFSPRQKQPGTITATTTSQSVHAIFSCGESACILTFKTEREAQAHMDTGEHVKELESVSLYDTIRTKWADKVTGISIAVGQPPTTVNEQEQGGQTSQNVQPRQQGWALKTTKKRQRFEEKVKLYLNEKFEMGEKYGNKVDPLSLSREMRVLKKDGKLYFQPSEWKTTQQIKSFFSRQKMNLRQKQLDVTEEDVEAWVSETDRQELRDEVCSLIQKPEHPITVVQLNICNLVEEGRLTTLTIAKLESICNALELEIEGSKARKKSYIGPLETFARTCTCQG